MNYFNKLSVSVFCWILLLILAVVWGSSFYAVSVALQSFSALEVACYRVILGAIVLTSISFIVGDGLPGFNKDGRSVWLYSFGMGLFTNVAPFTLLAWAQTKVSSSFAGITMSLVPLITLGLAHFLIRGELLTKNKILGLSIGFFGMILLFDGHKIISEVNFIENFKFKLACACAAICYAVGSIITKRSPNISGIAFGSSGLLMATSIIFPATIILEQFPRSAMSSSIIALLYLGIFSTGMATALLVYIIKKAGPTFLSLVNYMVPVWAIILGIGLNSETVQPIFILALIFIFLGMVISRIGVKN